MTRSRRRSNEELATPSPCRGLSDEDRNREQFLLTEAVKYAGYRELFALVFDIEGGLRAKQPGLATNQARRALHVAVDLTLADLIGPRVIAPTEAPFSRFLNSVTWLSHQWRLIHEIWGPESSITRTLCALELEVPSGEIACVDYVQRCKAMIEQLTGLRLEVSHDALRDLLRRFYAGAELLAACGYAGRDKLFVFGSAGYKQAGEVDLYEYVDEHLSRLAEVDETQLQEEVR